MNASPKHSLSVSDAENVISIKASLVARIAKEKPGLYVSYCPALDLYSQGKTEREAEKKIIEATHLFIEFCIEDHTLEEVLADCGFSLATRPSTKNRRPEKTELPPEFSTARKITFPAEFPMLAYR